MYGGGLGGGTVPVVAGATTIAALPNTGGSRNVVMYVAIASIALGVAVLVSTTARLVAKRYLA